MGLSCFLLCVDEFLLCVLSLDCVEMYMGDFNPQHESVLGTDAAAGNLGTTLKVAFGRALGSNHHPSYWWSLE